MVVAHERQLVQYVQFIALQRGLRRVLDNVTVIVVTFYQPSAVYGFVAPVLKCKAPAVLFLRGFYGLEIRKDHVVILDIRILHPHACAVYPRYVLGLYPGFKSFSDLYTRTLSHPVYQYIGSGIHQYRSPDLVVPVVIMSQSPEAGFEPAYYHRHIFISFACTVAVDYHRAVRPPAAFAARRIYISAPPVLEHRIVVHHRIHVAAVYQKSESGLSESPEIMRIIPCRL